MLYIFSPCYDVITTCRVQSNYCLLDDTLETNGMSCITSHHVCCLAGAVWDSKQVCNSKHVLSLTVLPWPGAVPGRTAPLGRKED
jgi:hypothetical protein